MKAPTVAIEAISVVRPLKVLGCTISAFSLVFCFVGTCSSAWLEAQNFRQGLWMHCNYPWYPNTTFITCQYTGYAGWLNLCRSLMIIALITNFFAVLTLGFGLQSVNYHKKFFLYRISMYTSLLTVICLVITLIVFPANFLEHITKLQKNELKFKWAYALLWVAAVLVFGNSLLLLVDKETEEIYYREKTIYPDEDDLEELTPDCDGDANIQSQDGPGIDTKA